MKKCSIKTQAGVIQSTFIGVISISNKDDKTNEPYIREVTFGTKIGTNIFNIQVTIENETPTIKKQFQDLSKKIPRSPEGTPDVCKYLSIQAPTQQPEIMLPFLKLIQQIDPLPFDALNKVTEFLKIPNQFLRSLTTSHDLMLSRSLTERAEKGEHKEALELALKMNSKGDNEALPLLVNLYQEANDENNYFNVLAHIPKTHEQFKFANEQLHNHLLSKPIPEDKDERIALLEKKFLYAFNAELEETANYFNQLCGDTGLNAKIEVRGNNPETLIQIARMMRELRDKYEELRDENEELKDQLKSQPQPLSGTKRNPNDDGPSGPAKTPKLF